MVDYVVLFIPRGRIADLPMHCEEYFVWNALEFFPQRKRGKYAYSICDTYPLDIFSFHSGISVRGSLHKYIKHNNYSQFTFSELNLAIETLCNLFNVPPEVFLVKKLEYGLNIVPQEVVANILSRILRLKGKLPDRMLDSCYCYGKKFFFSDYNFKLYDKEYQAKKDNWGVPHNLLRVEIQYKRQRRLPNITTLKDLTIKEKLHGLQVELEYLSSKVLFDPIKDYSCISLAELTLASAIKDNDFWKALDMKGSRQARGIKNRVEKLSLKYGWQMPDLSGMLRCNYDSLIESKDCKLVI